MILWILKWERGRLAPSHIARVDLLEPVCFQYADRARKWCKIAIFRRRFFNGAAILPSETRGNRQKWRFLAPNRPDKCPTAGTQPFDLVEFRTLARARARGSKNQATLEDTFIALTGHSIREADAAPIDRMRRMRQVWLGRR